MADSAAPQGVPAEWTQSTWVRVVKGTARGVGSLCYWIIPCLWLVPASIIASYVISQIWPQVLPGSLWVAIPSAIILALVLSYLPFRGFGRIVSTIGVIQTVAFVVFAIMAVAHHASRPEGSQVWVLDSTGTPVQFVQDTVPDPTRTIPDPSDPSKQIQDPNAMVPKVDSNGSSIPVYNAVDAKGNVLRDGAGNPIVVPTDAEGKLLALPAGVAKALPAPYTVLSAGGTGLSDGAGFQLHYPSALQPTKLSLSAAYGTALGCMALFSLVVFQFVASLGSSGKHAVSGLHIVPMLLLIILQCGGALLTEYTWKTAAPAAFLAPGSNSAPIGDVMQLVGAWTFGSSRAGWWFMMAQASVLLLVLLAAVWSCFSVRGGSEWVLWRTGVAASHATAQGKADGTSRIGVLLRAGVAIVFCVLALLEMNCTSGLQGGVAATLGDRPVPISHLLLTLTVAVAWSVFLWCAMICWVSWAALRAEPRARFGKHAVAPAVGLAAGVACVVSYLASPLLLREACPTEFYWAGGLCAVWVCGVAMHGAVRRMQ